jgi:hypothetical protein
MTNTQKLSDQPFGDNLVARCDNCGKPVFKCTCDEDEAEEEEEHEQDVDAFGRNYSDADPGL